MLRRLLEGLCLLVLSLLLLLHLQAQLFVLPSHSLNSSVKNKDGPTFTEKVASRRRRIADVCERHNASLVWDDRRRLKSMRRHLWDIVNHLVYCPIAKVASTTWFSNFLAWSKIDRDSVPLRLNQLKEAGGTKDKAVNWEGEAGGRGIRALAR